MRGGVFLQQHIGKRFLPSSLLHGSVLCGPNSDTKLSKKKDSIGNWMSLQNKSFEIELKYLGLRECLGKTGNLLIQFPTFT